MNTALGIYIVLIYSIKVSVGVVVLSKVMIEYE